MRHVKWVVVAVVTLLCLLDAGLGQVAYAGGKEDSATVPVRSGCEVGYPPYCFVTPGKGEAAGFAVDLLQASLEAMGRTASFKTGRWADLRQDLAEGRVQALPLVGRTPEREAIFDFTFPYLTVHGAIVVREDTDSIHGPADLRGRRVAVLQGDNAQEYLERARLGAVVVPLPTFEAALRELSAGRHDAVVIQELLALELIRNLGIQNLRVLGPHLQDFTQSFCFAVRRGDRALLAVLNEGLSISIANGTFRRLQEKWFAPLEAQQRARSRIVVGGDSEYPPYEYKDANGQPAGFNSDLTRAVADQVGLQVDIHLDSWATTRDRLKRGEIDLVQGMFYSTERDRDFEFSPPYAVVHYVVVTRHDSPALSNLKELHGRSVLVQAGDIMHDLAVAQGLEKDLAPVESQEEALRLLSEGRHDCALVARVPALYWIEKHGWTNLRVGNATVLSAEYCYAAPRGKAALLSRFTEGLAAARKSGQYREIQARWLGAYASGEAGSQQALKYTLWAVIPLLGLLMLSWAWSRTVRRRVERALAESETRFRALFENSPIAMREEDFSAVHERFGELRRSGVTDLRDHLERNPEEVWRLAGLVRVLDANQASLSLVGATSREELVRELPRCLSADALPALREEMVALAGGARTFSSDFPSLDLLGQEKLCQVSLSVVPGHEQRLSRVIVSFVDVTAQRHSQVELEASEEKHRIVADNTYDWEFWVGPDGSFVYCSPSCARISGYEASEFTARPGVMASIVHSEDRAVFDRHMCASRLEERPGECEFRIVRRDGEVRWIGHVCQPVFGSDGSFLGNRGSNRDITQRRSHEAEIERLGRIYASLSELNQAIVRVRTRDDLFRETCRVLVEHGGVKTAWISRVDPDTRAVSPLARFGDTEDFLDGVRVYADDRPEGRGPTGMAFREGHSFVYNDFLHDPRTQPWHEVFASSGWGAAAAFPLRSGGEVCAVLTVYAREAGFFGARETALLEESAADVSFALDHLQGDEQRRRIEEALRESEERMRYSLEASHTGAWDLDLQRQTLTCTAEYYRILGYEEPVGEWSVERFLQHVVPEDRYRVEREMRRAIDHQAEWGVECRILRRDSEKRWIWICGRHRRDAEGGAGRVVGIVHDVTERRRVEEALLENSLHLEMTVRAANVGLWDWDLATDHVFYSAEWKRQIGYEEHEISSDLAEWQSRVHPDDAQKVAAAAWLAREARASDTRVEFRLRHKDGSYRWMLAQAALLRDVRGNPARAVGANLDVTERKRTEEVLRQSEKMRVVGQMAGGIAHDFNNLLCGVIGYAALLKAGLEHEPRLQRQAEVIMTAGQRAADLTARLRALSRRDDVVSEQIDLHKIIQDAIALLSHSLDRTIRLLPTLEASPSTILGDASQIQNAIVNLVLNARDAMPDGGDIALATRVISLGSDLPGAYNFDLVAGTYVAVSVSDSGIGMGEEVRSHLFEPFFTTKAVGEGTGLGLANVWACVKSHRGGIAVDSEPGRGTTFTLHFPLLSASPAKAPVAAEAPVRGEGFVLVVDDESSLRELARDLLRQLGYRTAECANGREAVEYCRAHGESVDVVLLDMIMPEMDGQKALAALAELHPTLPVILCSGAFADGPARQLDGAAGFIQKPYKFGDLARKVADVIGSASHVRPRAATRG